MCKDCSGPDPTGKIALAGRLDSRTAVEKRLKPVTNVTKLLHLSNVFDFKRFAEIYSFGSNPEANEHRKPIDVNPCELRTKSTSRSGTHLAL